jgi:preprotein translocase subunit SecG
MGFIIGVLTVVMVLNCLLLILLVLIQLPKKEAGAGLAFGGATTDALFGAGSGNALTKITKYATVIFFILALSVGYLQSRQPRTGLSNLESKLPAAGAPIVPAGAPAASPGAAAPAGTPAPATPPPAPTGTNINLPTPPAPAAPDAPAPPK